MDAPPLWSSLHFKTKRGASTENPGTLPWFFIMTDMDDKEG